MKTKKRYIFRTIIVAVLLLTYFPLKNHYTNKQENQNKTINFKFELPFPEFTKSKYKITDNLEIEAVFIAGTFNGWAPDEAYKMKKLSAKKWTIELDLQPGRHEFKYVIIKKGTARTDYAKFIWSHNKKDDNLIPDGYDGKNTLFTLESYTQRLFMMRFILIAILSVIILMTILELFLKLLLHFKLSLKYKLLIIFIITLVLSNLFFIFFTYNQKKDFATKIQVDKINTIHSMLLTHGIDFGKFKEPKTIKKIETILQNFSLFSDQRHDYNNFSNTQKPLASVFLLDINGNPIIRVHEKNTYNEIKNNPQLENHRLQQDAITMSNLSHNHDKTSINLQSFNLNNFLPEPQRKTVLKGLQNRESYSTLFQENTFIYPIYHKNRKIGYYVLYAIPFGYQSLFQEARYLNLTILLIFVILYYFLFSNVGKMILHPLQRLIEGTKVVEQGDLSYKIDIKTNDEAQELTESFNKMTDSLKLSFDRVEKINISYRRFVPHEFLTFLNKRSITEIKLGDQVLKEMSILFCDIRSFTSLSESMSPEDNFNFLNSYLKRVGPVIRNNNGFIDKYIGDAIMALFPQSSQDALDSAIEMQKQVTKHNIQREKKHLIPINIGIGLHTGNLMLGIIGEAERMEGTVISDAVNLAARMEGLTKRYGASIVMSAKMLKGLDDPTAYDMRILDVVCVKGKTIEVSVFEILDGEPPESKRLKLETKADFENGFNSYITKKFTKAKKSFDKVLKANPTDKAAQLYLRRCENFEKHGVSIDWKGIDILDDK